MKKLLVITHKRFWIKDNLFYTNGGFLRQMETISKEFTKTTILCQKVNNNKTGIHTNFKKINIIPVKYFFYEKFSRKTNAIVNFPILFFKSIIEIHKNDVLHVILPGEGFVGLFASLFFNKKVVVRFCTSPKKEIYKMSIPFIKSSLYLLEKLKNSERYTIYFTGLYDNEVDKKWKDFNWIYSTTLKTNDIPEYRRKQTERLNLLFIGRLDDNKNVDFSIEVFRELLKKYSDATYTIIGSGPEEKLLIEQNNDLINSGNLIFKGYLTLEEMEKIKESSSVFIFPSKIEGSPKVIPEVFSFGIPVVCSTAGNLFWLVQNERGRVINDFDVNLYLNGILEVWKNSEDYLKYSKNAYNFSKELILEKWVKKMFDV